jgi:CheY-like chemotaxis protein
MSPTLRPKSPITRPHTHAEMVVVCDDDEDDWLLIEDAWTHVAPNVELRYTQDRQALLDLLTTMATQDDTFPALVLLDLNMPILNGWETLAAIKATDELQHIPIVIYTTSSIPGQRCAALAMNAAGCITKPADYRTLQNIMESLHTYWFTTNTPEPARHP